MPRILDSNEIGFVSGGVMVDTDDSYEISGYFGGGDSYSGGDVGGGLSGGDFGNGADDQMSGKDVAQIGTSGSGAYLGGEGGAVVCGLPCGALGAAAGAIGGWALGTAAYNAYQGYSMTSADNVHYQFMQYASQPGGQYYHDFD